MNPSAWVFSLLSFPKEKKNNQEQAVGPPGGTTGQLHTQKKALQLIRVFEAWRYLETLLW